MDNEQNKVAVVTGASRGIGRACAMALAEAGTNVVLASRGMDALKQVADEIRSHANGAVEALPLELDVSSEESIKTAFQKANEHFGKIDILVNNAGITRDGLMMRMKRQDWDAVINTNLNAAFLCIQQVLSGMVRRRYGRIINIVSVVAQMGNPGQANYAASKAGIIGLTHAIAQEVASRNITCNAIAPGYIETAMTEAISPEAREKLASRIPMGRLGQPTDIAPLVRFLASDEAAYITGQVINVNGGMYM
ncbi:MAG: 3-oxoacyl-[acyl-carrier-protein] reductase [Acidobacteria bacterium]|nr:3-oxoacyl-[acyl-carrier-protein] reductase [Acidobacteriota bacterium]